MWRLHLAPTGVPALTASSQRHPASQPTVVDYRAAPPPPVQRTDTPTELPTFRRERKPTVVESLERIPQPPRPKPRVHFIEQEPRGPSPATWAMLVMGAIACACAVTGLVVLLRRGPPPPVRPVPAVPARVELPPTLPPIVEQPPLLAPMPPAAPPGKPVASRPTAANEGQRWTVDELVRHLDGRGLKVTVADRIVEDTDGVVISRDRKGVIVVRFDSSASAAAEARAANKAVGDATFAWGRFCFVANQSPLMRSVRAELAR